MPTPAVLTEEKIADLTRLGVPADYHQYFAQLRLDGLIEKLGIHFEQISPELCVATMPVEGNTQVIGLLHGGASAALAETLGSLAAYLSVADQGKIAVGVDLNITHLRPASGGTVIATCRAIKLGASVCVHAIDVEDEAGKLIATARITNNIIAAPTR